MKFVNLHEILQLNNTRKTWGWGGGGGGRCWKSKKKLRFRNIKYKILYTLGVNEKMAKDVNIFIIIEFS